MTAAAKSRLASERRAIVDELGQLEQDIEPLKEKEKKASELRAVIRGWHEKDLATAKATHEGHKFTVTVGPKENQRWIKSMLNVLDLVGSEKFLANCSMTLAKLKDLVTPPHFEQYTEQDRTGARPVHSFARSKA